MSSLTGNPLKNKAQKRSPWLKNFLAKLWISEQNSSGKNQRDSFRLKIEDEEQPLTVRLTLQNGRTYHARVDDVSAGGFSSVFFEPIFFQPGETVQVDLQLPLDRVHSIKARGIFVNEEGNFKINRFRFEESMDEEGRDLIHQYVFKKQFEKIRKKESTNLAAVS